MQNENEEIVVSKADIDKELKELLTNLKVFCQRNKIPMFLVLNYDLLNNDDAYYKDMVSSFSCNKTDPDDKIAKLLNVMNGFDTIPPKKIIELIY